MSRVKRATYGVQTAIRNLDAAREAAYQRRLAKKRKAQDAAIAAQIPNHPW